MIDKNCKNILGSRIMQRRKQLGIKQSELAELIGVSDNQISNIENGKSFPRLNSFIKICDILDCNSDYFLSGIIKKDVDTNIIDLVASCSLEEQKTIWKLLDCYIHREDDNRI
ncbi:MAG: helix-turn-helix transcriptional regulator [Clostridia bacterium]|nr:helix-turn-helix transcriptional regulator [Clostridia bacterium]